MFHSRSFKALNWWDARELDPEVQAARLRDCNELAARQAAIYAETPDAPRKPDLVQEPSDFCRSCRGKGHTIDDPEEYGVGVKVSLCEPCAGTGWR